MKRYTITVNGNEYDVTVEENGAEGPVVETKAATPQKADEKPKAAAPATAQAANSAQGAGAIKIESPMPGTILDIKVAIGDTVGKGDVVCILEAMKMENELVAPEAGTVASINVSKGDSVEASQVVMTLN